MDTYVRLTVRSIISCGSLFTSLTLLRCLRRAIVIGQGDSRVIGSTNFSMIVCQCDQRRCSGSAELVPR